MLGMVVVECINQERALWRVKTGIPCGMVKCRCWIYIPTGTIQYGTSGADTYVGVTTNAKKANTKSVVTFKHPMNTVRPVPA